MRVNQALGLYRYSLASDSAAFLIASRIYLNGSLAESEIVADADMSSSDTKLLLRRLYLSGLVTLHRDEYALTSVGEAVLSALGVDAVVRPHLLVGLVGKANATSYERLADGIVDSRPEFASSVTRSLRNASLFSACLGSSPGDEELASDAIVGADPDVRTVLGAKGALWSSGARADSSRSVFVSHCLHSYDLVDQWLYDAASSTKSPSLNQSIQARVAFRLFDYISGSKSDTVLEEVLGGKSARSGRARKTVASAVSSLLPAIRAALDASLWAGTNAAIGALTNEVLILLLDQAVNKKRGARVETALGSVVAGVAEVGLHDDPSLGSVVTSVMQAVEKVVSVGPSKLTREQANELRGAALTLMTLAEAREEPKPP